MANRLARATSPYLRQHADNPVDWYEWGPEAFERARREDKPILLSVGYASCHWCHVMAHESFEDPATAELMNRLFVNVKVDREERPDVDALYMEAVQAMTGRGGWPMTVWLTPDGRPFYAGTYFPATDRHGMPSFRRVCLAVAEAWAERRQEVVDQADRLTEAIGRKLPPPDRPPTGDQLAEALRLVERTFDPVHGGFGAAPKFPQAPLLEFLLRARRRPWGGEADRMLGVTLERMARGGIFDQLGGGFARYSVDERWLVPHFEKMLYDNAQLARLYMWAGVELGNRHLGWVAEQTFGYMLRDLRHPDGGFYSAEDADSEGVEGKFYVWSHQEFVEVVGDPAEPICEYFGVTPEGNFEGLNVLSRPVEVAELAARWGWETEDLVRAVEEARGKLFEARSRRVRPGLDDKVVTAWNGLAIRALADAGAVWKRPELLDHARAAARFVLEHLTTAEGRLHRSWAGGRPGPGGFLDDYAAMAVGLFSLYAATGEVEWFTEAARLTRSIPDHFTDPDGGFFQTPDDGEALIKRPKDLMDNPAPSGTSLAVEALLLLYAYTGDDGCRRLAEETARTSGLLVQRYPSAVGHLLAVLTSVDQGLRELAVVGEAAEDVARPFWERYRPEVVLAMGRGGADLETVPLLEGRARPGSTVAYLCEDFTCLQPVETADELRELLGSATGRGLG